MNLNGSLTFIPSKAQIKCLNLNVHIKNNIAKLFCVIKLHLQ